jgi:hypothetical protein
MRFLLSLVSLWIPSLTLPFSKGGNTVAAGSTGFPPFEKGRVREGI